MNRSSTGVFWVITTKRNIRAVALACGGGVDQRTAIGWPEVWAVIKASAERRLGKPLLKAYLLLAVFGIVVIAVCIVVMHF
jgi:hypothetical protein